MTPDRVSLAHQIRVLHASNLYPVLLQAATDAGLPFAFVLGIASRETNCLNELGDHRGGEYHGVGIMQVDIQHEPARVARDNGSWQTHPDWLIHLACGMLQTCWHEVQLRTTLTSLYDQLHVTAAAYNCGLAAALRGHAAGDCDQHTTGGEYGRDVLARMQVFARLTEERA